MAYTGLHPLAKREINSSAIFIEKCNTYISKKSKQVIYHASETLEVNLKGTNMPSVVTFYIDHPYEI